MILGVDRGHNHVKAPLLRQRGIGEIWDDAQWKATMPVSVLWTAAL